MSKRATRRKSTHSKGLRCSFPPRLDVDISLLFLVRSPIVGCEGTGMGRSYSHRRQPMGHFSNVVLGTRLFTEGNIKGHRGITIFYRGSFAKTPMFKGHDYFSNRKQVRLP